MAPSEKKNKLSSFSSKSKVEGTSSHKTQFTGGPEEDEPSKPETPATNTKYLDKAKFSALTTKIRDVQPETKSSLAHASNPRSFADKHPEVKSPRSFADKYSSTPRSFGDKHQQVTSSKPESSRPRTSSSSTSKPAPKSQKPKLPVVSEYRPITPSQYPFSKPKSPAKSSEKTYKDQRSRSSAPKIKTAFTSSHDMKMATRQTKIDELKGPEIEEQEAWAHEKLRAHAGTCPMGFSWKRYTPRDKKLDGYRCLGGSHLVPHTLLAAGAGGVYIYNNMWIGFDSHNKLFKPPFIQWEGPIHERDRYAPTLKYDGMDMDFDIARRNGLFPKQRIELQNAKNRGQDFKTVNGMVESFIAQNFEKVIEAMHNQGLVTNGYDRVMPSNGASLSEVRKSFYELRNKNGLGWSGVIYGEFMDHPCNWPLWGEKREHKASMQELRDNIVKMERSISQKEASGSSNPSGRSTNPFGNQPAQNTSFGGLFIASGQNYPFGGSNLPHSNAYGSYNAFALPPGRP